MVSSIERFHCSCSIAHILFEGRRWQRGAGVGTSKKNVRQDFYNQHNGCPCSSWLILNINVCIYNVHCLLPHKCFTIVLFVLSLQKQLQKN